MKKYYLGLDIGTNSCGFAVTDENYNILRSGGKNFWGVRLFDEASTAADRRSKRAGRRRLNRKKMKIAWLNEIFSPEIDKVDKNMLSRIKYSSLWEEDKIFMDKRLTSKDSLFADKNYTDKDFFDEYPTIFHLRKELTKRPARDVRHLYLAIHSIIKNRGHFLYEGDFGNDDETVKLADVINEMTSYAQSLDSEEFKDNLPVEFEFISEEKEKQIFEVLKQKLGIRDTKAKFYEIFEASNKIEKAIIDIMLTGKTKVKDFLNVETEEELKIIFDVDDFETQLSSLSSLCSEEQITLIQKLCNIYNNINLKKIIGESNYICEAMVNLFDEHKEDLKMFKNFIRTYYKDEYFNMFRNAFDKPKSPKYTNYVNYVGGSIYKGKKRVVGINSSKDREEFYKYVKMIIDSEPNLECGSKEDYENTKAKIKNKIENNTFLPKLRTKANAVLPNKLYLKELKQILKVNAEKFPFLNEKDESGLSAAEKIIEIAKFRVPYFVGPIGKSDFGWAKKIEGSENIKYYPWTLNKIVNFDECEDCFIENLTNTCTYLIGRDVLAKHSLVYSKFRVLNELNKLKIDGNDISVELKQKIYTNLFEKNKKITTNKLIEFLVCEGIIEKDHSKDVAITGIDREFANSLISLNELKGKGGFSQEFIDENFEIFEKIIKYHTIISDKNRLVFRVQREYPNFFTDEQLKFIKSLNFSGWGSLSLEFLCGMKFENKVTGEVTCVLDELWNTNQNLMQIINNSNYTIQEKIFNANSDKIKGLDYEAVKEMYCSPAVKRGVWQTLKIIKEVEDLMGGEPEKIFVEVTRKDETKGDAGRKLSRQNSIKMAYQSKDFKQTIDNIDCDLEMLNRELNNRENNEFKSEKLYLYFMQLGKCAYSGETIDITDLYNDNLYDVDHIIPQSLLKDDSLNNKVLVKKQYNSDKGDHYPISQKYPNWVAKQKPFWEQLVKMNLMSKSKFERLIRVKPLTDEEISAFVERQIVETNQSSKAVTDLLKAVTGDKIKIIYSKANFVSEFRNMFEIYKSREVNDLHHAKDAYLNIVVGNIFYSRFTEDPRNFYKDEKNPNAKLTKNPVKLFESQVKNFKGDIIWDKDKNLAKIKEVCFRNDPIVTRMSYSELNGGFYDETVYKSRKNDPNTDAKISLKGKSENPISNCEKYGGYNKLKIAYFMVVESDGKKGERQKTIEAVPVLVYQQNKNYEDKDKRIFEYVVRENKLENAKLILPKLNIKSVIRINGGEYLLAGKTGDLYILHNFNQWFVDNSTTRYVKNLIKYQELKKAKVSNFIEENGKVVISKPRKKGNKEISLSREENIELYDKIIKQLKKSIYRGLNIQNVGTALDENRDKFLGLDVIHQANLLLGVIPRISTGASLADLSELGLPPKSGLIRINKKITNLNIELVMQSSTGIKQRVIKL